MLRTEGKDGREEKKTGCGANGFFVMDYCISSVDGMRNDFQKRDYQEENPFAKGISPVEGGGFGNPLPMLTLF